MLKEVLALPWDAALLLAHRISPEAMKFFLSYASEDRPLAEEIQLALAGAGHEVFFDRESLPAGGDYHARIKASVDAAICSSC